MNEALQHRPDGLTHMPAQVAASWARAGFRVFPCGQDKRPLTPHGFRDATSDLQRVAAYWQQHPRALVGLPTGEASGLFVVDLDTDRETGEAIGEASLGALGLSHLVGSVPTVATPSGGRHLYFRDCGLGNSSGRLGRKIDTRGTGGYVIAPGSVTPNGVYSLLTGQLTRETLTDVPEALIARLRGRPDRDPLPAPPRIDPGQTGSWAEAALHGELGRVMAAQEGARNHTLNRAAFSLAQIVAGGGLEAGATRARLLSAALAIGLTEGEALATIASGMSAGMATPRQAPNRSSPPAQVQARNAPYLAAPTENAEAQLVLDRKGRPVWCAENACRVLETHPAWQEALAFDEFAGLTLLLKPVPGTTTPRTTFAARPLADTDITSAVRWFNRHGFPDATKNTTADALYAVAAQSIISPVRHYLESLSWDGVSRVGDWLVRYCGAENTNFTRKAGQAWLISAVARALQPGCKADCALVLEGRQGQGKSSALKVLAGEAWFHDGLHDLHSKDASAGLRGKWIIELPELSAMRRSDTEAVKAFLSRTEERYRPAYGRAEVVEPRRCVFAGTTNRSDYLTDDTGGRRFWPVVVNAVQVADLTRDRDQIWAEAVALLRAGKNWWLDRETESEAAAVVAVRAADDPWSADVLSSAEKLSEVSTRDVFQLMGIPCERQTKADAMRITGILTRAGWTRAGKFTSGPNRDLARYLPPEVKR